VKRFLVLGACGAIHPLVRILDIVVPTWGIREEGTSYHYLPPHVVPKPSERIVEILRRELDPVARGLGAGLHLGGVWSTDAVYRETRDKVRRYSEMNALCVDMESTALMSVAMYRGVELGIALIVTDELHGEKWRFCRDRERAELLEREVTRALLEALAKA